MELSIAFLTGARSEYSLAKDFLFALESDEDFELAVVPNGMHLLESYGMTVNEIREDGFYIFEEVPTYADGNLTKSEELSRTVRMMRNTLSRLSPDAVFIIGDRIEAYGSALAAHFADIPIIHSGGGHLTPGAVDNIYRYNISNLSDLHFVTSRGAYERLIKCALVESKNVHFVGSVAVDQIKRFKEKPKEVDQFVPGLEENSFALMTFHPVTSADEDITDVMKASIEEILNYDTKVLLTYPNNDKGSGEIMSVIDCFRIKEDVFAEPHLGAEGYYAALDDCLFAIGNSSSGIMEAPYFHKPVIDIGSRQEGRAKDDPIVSIPSTPKQVRSAIKKGFSEGWPEKNCSHLYGKGNSVMKVIKNIKNYFSSTSK
ncbi:UDP-N-acetylglucosamine 2-epimerase [Salinibacter ruber]|uniref:UDP-N-acetylglucosamine 2-epimerase n=1 Tax=Salinibacter ruber TaxID=146919 RepID=UPI0021691D41|nr:UDP-N-acetylglucosamine 2-epimerase [Salinibacter ruber]MCS4049226.1 UDP-hydrolyzing UDP-N-acetyl-D-glucosamine 2-epimerase [Salinibacter ruber]